MRVRVHQSVLLLLVCTIFSVCFSGTSAIADGDRKKGQAHFEPFEFAGGGEEDYVYFTLFIKPTKQQYLLDLCKQEPRVRETVYKMLYGRDNLHKWGLKNRLLAKASAALKARINKAVKDTMVDEAYFIRGYLDFEQGPIENPDIPHPLTCTQIYFQAKSLKGLGDD